jgi:DNA-binding NarL/FixJ family response regulator
MSLAYEIETSKASRRVLVVDDHRLVAEGLLATLQYDGFDASLSRCESFATILDEASQCKPDVVVLDLRLGQVGHGRDLIGPLASLGAAVIVLTGLIDGVELASCLEAGAAGVARKGEGFDSIITKIRAVLEGKPVIPMTERAQLLAELEDRRSADRSKSEPFETLTKREAEVLRQIMDGVPAETIAGTQFVSVPTVRSQIRSILQKLGVNSQLEASARAWASGWRRADVQVLGRGDAGHV